jgi:hypothetical protein
MARQLEGNMGNGNSLKEIHRTTFCGLSTVCILPEPVLLLATTNKYCTVNQQCFPRPLQQLQPHCGYFNVCFTNGRTSGTAEKGGWVLLVCVLRKECHGFQTWGCFRVFRDKRSVFSPYRWSAGPRRFDSADTHCGNVSNRLLTSLTDRGGKMNVLYEKKT